MALNEELILQAREQLAEEDAVNVREYQSTSVPLLSDAELQRTWDETTEDIVPHLIEFLETYTSAKNDSPRRYVDDPKVDNVVVPGRWRQAFIRRVTSGDITRLVQVLRKGYITALVKGGAIDWSEARATESRHLPTNSFDTTSEHYLRVSWPNVSPDHVHAIVTSLDTIDPDTLTASVRGENWGSSFHRLFTTHRLEDDGSATILMYLAKPEYRLYAYADFLTERRQDVIYLWNVPKTLAQGILTDWKAKGRGGSAAYNSGEGLVDLVLRERNYTGGYILGERTGLNCDADQYSYFYWGIEDPTGYDLPDPFAQGQSGTKNISNNLDGSYDVRIDLRQTLERTFGDHLRSLSTLQEQREYIQLGIVDDANIPDISSPAIGTVYRQDIRIREDCSKDVTTIQDRGLYAAAGPTLSRRGALGFVEATEIRNNAAPIAASTPSQGQIFQSRSTLNEFGYYDGGVQKDESYAASVAFSSELSTFRTTESIIYKNSRTVIEGVAPDSGFYRVRQQPNEDGTYDGDLSYTQSTDAGEARFESQDAPLGHEVAVIYRSRSTQVDAPTAAQGEVYAATNSLGEDGLYDARLERRLSVEKVTPFHSADSASRTSDSIIYTNSRTLIEAPAITGAGIYRVEQGVNPDGTYNARLVYDNGKDEGIAEFRSSDATLGQETSVVYRGMTAPVEAAASSQGAVYRSANTLQEDGTYDARFEYAYSKGATTVFVSDASVTASGNTLIYRNWRDTVTAPPSDAGGLYRVTQAENQDGTFDAQLVYVLATELNAPFTSRTTAFQTGSSIIYRASRTVVSAPPTTGSGTYVVTQSQNTDGTYDAVMTYISGTNAGEAQFTASDAALQSSTEVIYRSRETQVDAPDAPQGQIYQASNTLGDDGLYDARLSHITSHEAILAVDETRSAVQNQNIIVYRNTATKVDAPASAQGHIYRATDTINADGTYDADLVYAESIPAVIYVTTMRSELQDSDEIVYLASRDTIESPASVQGGMYRVQARPNADGTYDGNVVYDGAKEGELYISWLTRMGTAAVWRWRNVTSVPPEVAALCDTDNDWSATGSINIDGSYDISLQKNPLNNPEKIVDWEAGSTLYWHFTNRQNRDIYVYDLHTNSTSRSEDWISRTGSAAFAGDTNLVIGEDSGKQTDRQYLGWGRWFARRVELKTA